MPTGLKIPKLWPQITPSEPIKKPKITCFIRFIYCILEMISCGMRRLYGEHALIKGSDGAHPHGKHSQRYIRRRRSARYLRQTCVSLPKFGRYTSENNSLICISYIITSPLSKISDLFVFRAFRAIKNSLRSLNIHRKVRR